MTEVPGQHLGQRTESACWGGGGRGGPLIRARLRDRQTHSALVGIGVVNISAIRHSPCSTSAISSPPCGADVTCPSNPASPPLAPCCSFISALHLLRCHGFERAPFTVAAERWRCPGSRVPGRNAPLQPPPGSTASAAVAAAAAASGAPQSLKLTYPETLDRIKEEFQFLQTQYHSLKLECEKLATEKTEIQRHYVMYYEMSYGLNIEMHKQTEIAKRLNHQQQVIQAMERAKQVTMGELNASIGQQLQAQHLSQHAAQGLPMAPHPSGLQHPGLALGGGSGLLALSGALGAQLAAKDERAHLEAAAAAAAAAEHHRDKGRPSDYLSNGKKRKADEKDFMTDYGSDADKSDDNLVVDEDPSSPRSVQSYSSRENGLDKLPPTRKEAPPQASPTSLASSSSAASPSRSKEPPLSEKSNTPGLKPGTPMPSESSTPGPSAPPQFRPVSGKAGVDPLALGLRNPLAVHGAYPPGAFGLPPPGVNGEMSAAAAAAAYGAGLHLVSPQINGAASAAGYGRPPVVRELLVGYESPHPHMRVPGLPASLQASATGK
ncbi:hypothetical protein Z043_122475, partial [Scleropages formosus]